MKIDCTKPRSSNFAMSGKDLQNIVGKIIGNQNILKLLKYPVVDATSKPDLSKEETRELVNKNIRIVPRIPYDDNQESVIIITFDNFIENKNNPEYRDNMIMIDVLCPTETWIMNDYLTRPFKIMHELDSMLNRAKLNGIGKTEFVSANSLILSDELAGYTLLYRVVNDV